MVMFSGSVDKYSSSCNILWLLLSWSLKPRHPQHLAIQPVTMITRWSSSGGIASIRMLCTQHCCPAPSIVLGLKAITLGLLAQLLMFGLEMAIELSSFPFPSSILAMFLLFVFLLALGCCWDGFEHCYIRHLRQPVSLSRSRSLSRATVVSDHR